MVIDFNKDGLLDLIIGCRDGNVYYYENTGSTSNFDLTFRTDSLGGVTSRNDQLLGYSSPSLGDFNNDGNTDLLLGGFNEGLKFYSNIGTDYTVPFTLSNANFLNETNFSANSAQGFDPRLTPLAGDLTNNGQAELLVGINNGGLLFYSQDESIADTNVLATNSQIISELIKVFPNPCHSIVHIDWGKAFEKGSSIELNLYNLMGKLMFSEKIDSYATSHQLNVSEFPSGLYLLNVVQGNLLGSIRVVKY